VVPGTEDGLAYWMIDEQLFPRRVGALQQSWHADQLPG